MNCVLKNDAGLYILCDEVILKVTACRWKAKVYRVVIKDGKAECDPPPPNGTWYPESL